MGGAMRLNGRSQWAAGGIGALLLGACVCAAPVRYQFTGVGTGELNGTVFSSAPFTLALAADTDDLIGGLHVFVITGSGVAEVEGFPTTVFLTEPAVFADQTRQAVSFRRGLQGPKLIDISDDVFAGYALEVPFGPVDVDTSGVLQDFQDIQTSEGLLTINTIEQLTFTAIWDCDSDGEPDLPTEDCDGNGIPDGCDIADDPEADCNGDGVLNACELAGGAPDINADGIPDECNCLADFSGDGSVGATDFLIVFVAWGTCEPGCSGDATYDGIVNVHDMLEVLAAWGDCP